MAKTFHFKKSKGAQIGEALGAVAMGLGAYNMMKGGGAQAGQLDIPSIPDGAILPPASGELHSLGQPRGMTGMSSMNMGDTPITAQTQATPARVLVNAPANISGSIPFSGSHAPVGVIPAGGVSSMADPGPVTNYPSVDAFQKDSLVLNTGQAAVPRDPLVAAQPISRGFAAGPQPTQKTKTEAFRDAKQLWNDPTILDARDRIVLGFADGGKVSSGCSPRSFAKKGK